MTTATPQTLQRAWIYARYSTDKQSQKSIDDQLVECRRLCAQNGWRVEKVLTEAELSGFIDQRPRYQELLSGIEGGQMEVVVAENIERLTRDGEHSAVLDKLRDYHRIKIWTVIDGEVTTMMFGLKSLMSAELLRSLAAQAHRGLAGNIAQGRSAGGCSYGYEVPRDDRGDRRIGELSIVEEQAEVVHRIMEEYASGRTPQKIASDLNTEGIPSPSGVTWRQNTINGNPKRGTGIINNELYIGVRVWNRLEYRRHPRSQKRVSRLRPKEEWHRAEVPHLSIVSDDLWDRVKRRQAGLRSKNAAKNVDMDDATKPTPYLSRRPKYLLSGLLSCARCGGKLTIAGSARKRYYCQRAKEEGRSACAGITGLPQVEAEAAVLAGMKRELMQPEAVAAFRVQYKAEMANANGTEEAARAALDKQLHKTDKQIANATRAIMDGVTSQALLGQLRKAEAQKADLEVRILDLAHPKAEMPADLDRRYAALVQELQTILATPDLIMEAIDMLKQLVDRIVVEEAPGGGHLLDVQGDLARMMKASAPDIFRSDADLSLTSLGMVAGVGFEPTTFRL